MNERSFIDKQILKEVEDKKAELDRRSKQSSLHLAWSKLWEKALRKDALVHSYKIENPGIDSNTTYNTHASRRSVRRGIDDLRRALKFGQKEFEKKGFSEELVQRICAKIEPTFGYTIAPFRTGNGTRIMDDQDKVGWLPPRREKLYGELEKYEMMISYYMNQDTILDALEGSAFAHLHLVRIHPFDDGNGRTARMLNSILLDSKGLPPPIIYEGERHDYYRHLSRAIQGYNARMATGSRTLPETKEEDTFYNYIAGKVSASLDRLLS